MTNKIEDSPVKWLCEKLSKYDEEMLFLYQEEIKEAEEMEKKKEKLIFRNGYVQGKTDYRNNLQEGWER
jgi:hypothetical protein